MIRSIEWCSDAVRFIDQTALPSKEIWIRTSDIAELAEAIRTLKVRGAPLIGIAAAYGILLGLLPYRNAPIDVCLEHYHASADLLAATRPTAKNLFWALERMNEAVRLNHTNKSSVLFDMLEEEAVQIHDDDRRKCASMGFYGAQLIENDARILTHCNTGALATGGIGTALGMITTAFTSGKKLSVFVDETRPLFQGARLTMWELQKNNIPATLITDSSAAWTIKNKKIDMIVVGADRIVANGDVANKIGTYALAILARTFNIPFYVVAPTSTIDITLASGEEIPIEERQETDVTAGFVNAITPQGSRVYAPAFDVTPAALITALITERGIHRPPYAASLRKALEP